MGDGRAAAGAGVPRSSYRELRPAPALAKHVLCLWAQAIGDGQSAHRHRVLPDGCIDIVWIGEAPPAVAGPATRTVLVELPPRTIVVGVRFHPGMAPSLLGPPAVELLDREVPLGQIWGRGADELSARVGAEAKVAHKLAIAEAALAARAIHARPGDPLVAAAVGWLARHPGDPVERLSALLDIGSRQLRRRFRASVGYGPKTLQRVLRLQRVLTLAGGGARSLRLAALAAEAGYADQAHMTRELGALTARVPTALLAKPGSTLAMSDLFKTPADAAL
jgi:AraC-like DNA-binding protein